MGVGVGFAVAAALWCRDKEPGKRVVCVEGDSAFGFSGMEIETLVRYCHLCTLWSMYMVCLSSNLICHIYLNLLTTQRWVLWFSLPRVPVIALQLGMDHQQILPVSACLGQSCLLACRRSFNFLTSAKTSIPSSSYLWTSLIPFALLVPRHILLWDT